MGTITKTFTETYARPTDAASTWTVVFEQLSDVVVSASTFKLVYPASAKAKYSAYSGKAYASIGGILTISSIDDALTITAEYRHAGTWAGNTYENLARSGAKYTTYKTSDFFNTTNPTERTIPLYAKYDKVYASSAADVEDTRPYGDYSNKTAFTDEPAYSVILDAPPTFGTPTISFNTTEPYAQVTIASVAVNDLSAKYGGTITKVKVQIGNETAELDNPSSSSVSLLLPLWTAGTFTPTITVTDSRGQTTTQTLADITVKQYNVPSAVISVERVNANGVTDDEGVYGLITAEITYTSVVGKLLEPTLTVDGVTVTNVNWYSDRTLTSLINWTNYNPASPATIYGHFGGSFSTQNSYLIGLTPIDEYNSGTEQTQTLATAFYTIDFKAGGHGIAFGQSATRDGFECNMPATFNQGIDIASGTKYKIGGTALSALDIGAVPTIRTINSKTLNSDVVLVPSDIGIHMSTSAPTSSDGNDGDIWIVYSAN